MTAAVLLPAGFVLDSVQKGDSLPLLTITMRSRGHAELHQISLHRVGAALAETEVVFRGAALVAVAFDVDARAGPALQPGRVGRQRGPAFVLDRRRCRDRNRRRRADARCSAAPASSARRSRLPSARAAAERRRAAAAARAAPAVLTGAAGGTGGGGVNCRRLLSARRSTKTQHQGERGYRSRPLIHAHCQSLLSPLGELVDRQINGYFPPLSTN